MSRRIREAIEEFVQLSGPISDYARDVNPWTQAKSDLELAIAGDPLEPTGLERLCAAADLMVARGVLDARSPVFDARIDVGPAIMQEAEALEVLAEPRRHLDKQRADAKFLRASGLLFEVNRRVLHPLGVAIGVVIDSETDDPLRIAPELLRTNDREGIVFEDEVVETGFRVLRTYMKAEGYERLAARYAALGFRGQVQESIVTNADSADWTPARRKLTAAARDAVEAAEALLEEIDDEDDDASEYAELVQTLRSSLRRLRMREAAESAGPDADPETVAAVETAISAGFSEEPRPLYFVRIENGRIGEENVRRIEEAMKESVESARELAAELSVDGRKVVVEESK